MELQCPACCAEVADVDAASTDKLRCENCGERFERGSALVFLRDVEPTVLAVLPWPLFTLRRGLASYKLRWSAGLWTIREHSDAGELDRLFRAASELGVIRSLSPHTSISIYPHPVEDFSSRVAVTLGRGQELLGPALNLERERDEDPITHTLRILGEGVEEANVLAGQRHPDSVRLDRIAAFMNEQQPWNGGDVCEFVACELQASGRRLLDAE